MTQPIPVILDTDIGMDVDDVWALAFLLCCPELDVRLVVSSTGDTHYGAAIAAKLLEVANRTDVDVGVGIPLDEQPKTHLDWLGDYQLSNYPGNVYADGVGEIIEQIRSSTQPITIISIGPLANMAAALSRAPNLINNSRFVGMHGSLRVGYLGKPKPSREYNVKKHTQSAQRTLGLPWDITLTPLDSCGDIHIRDDRLAQLRASDQPLTQAVIANHEGWFNTIDWPITKMIDPAVSSSILFDTVAVYLGFSTELLKMETLKVAITDDARMVEDNSGQSMHIATSWRDQEKFLDLVTQRLLTGPVPATTDRTKRAP